MITGGYDCHQSAVALNQRCRHKEQDLPTLNLQTNWIDIDKSIPKSIKNSHDTWHHSECLRRWWSYWIFGPVLTFAGGVSFVQWSNFFGGQLTQAQRGFHLSVKLQFNLASKYVRIYRNVDATCWVCSYCLLYSASLCVYMFFGFYSSILVDVIQCTRAFVYAVWPYPGKGPLRSLIQRPFGEALGGGQPKDFRAGESPQTMR